jgi:hypothetical protein
MLAWCKELGSPSFVNQNWPDDPTIGFDDKTRLVDLNVFGEVEEDIDFEFPDEVDDHLKECI